MALRSYRELTVWQQAMELVLMVYRDSRSFPREELYGLTGQLRRAAISVPSNIAEGQGRRSTKEFLKHLSIARGSLLEVQTQIEIGLRLKFVSAPNATQVQSQSTSVLRLLNGLINAL